jgi:hypothetical protein
MTPMQQLLDLRLHQIELLGAASRDKDQIYHA